MYLIFGTIYNTSNVIVMQVVPNKSAAKITVSKLSHDDDLRAISWHVHMVGYSKDVKSSISNIKIKLRTINANRTINPKKRTNALMPNAEKQMLDKFSAKHQQK